MAEVESVAAGIARALIDYAASKGAPPAELTRIAGIASKDLADQDNRIALTKYVALMRAAKELSNDDVFALHFGEAVDIAEMSVVGLLGRSADTPGEALTLLNRYARLIIDVDSGGEERFQLSRRRGRLWMLDMRSNPNEFPELTESTFARMACAISRAFGEPQAIEAVHVTHAEPRYRDEYERIFQVPVTFESDLNGLAMNGSWLEQRVRLQPRYALGILAPHAEILLERLDRSHTTRGRVESLLLPVLHTSDARRSFIAAKLGISGPTLQRRLKEEGTSFEKALDELRRKMALYYLSERHCSISETAQLVGFSDSAAFSRAFKRWTGKNPRAVLADRS